MQGSDGMVARVLRKIFLWKRVCIVFLVLLTPSIALQAQTFTSLFSFDATDGGNPNYVALVQGPDGNFYGTTSGYGSNNGGTVFKITPSGVLTTIYNFCSLANCADGKNPYAGLILGTSGNFYGTTLEGGTNNCSCGTVFEITSSGKLTTLHSFSGYPTDGSGVYSPLVQANNGNFYGTTSTGGTMSPFGTVFEISPGGVFTTLYNFCITNCYDGSTPYGGLIQATNGNLYGTTAGGGMNNGGTVFSIPTTGGTVTTIYSFCTQRNEGTCTDGSDPYSTLVEGTDGNFYGTTLEGGANDFGSVFKVTPTGTLTTLHSFCSLSGCADGALPFAGLVQGTDGNFYGTTSGGDDNGTDAGISFEITPAGTLTTLYNFCSQNSCGDGSYVTGGLLQATNGTFYGTTERGGTGGGYGTVFSLSNGLGSYVKFLPASGKVGQEVGILGNNLKGATSVTFNGTAAKFSVPEPGVILTHVPNGATSGYIKVTVKGNTLVSNVLFEVVK